MIQSTYINLPVSDLPSSREFFAACGFQFDDRYSDETAAAMVLDDNTVVMLLTRAKFKEFTPHDIADSNNATEVIVTLQIASRQEVDDLVRRAVENGATLFSEPQDHGFMYGHGFKDPDGHIWEVIAITGE
jgi:predicted lactoylglutathione lyase